MVSGGTVQRVSVRKFNVLVRSDGLKYLSKSGEVVGGVVVSGDPVGCLWTHSRW